MFDECNYSLDYLMSNWWEKWNAAVKVGLSVLTALFLLVALAGGVLFVDDQLAPNRNAVAIDSLAMKVRSYRFDQQVMEARIKNGTLKTLQGQLREFGFALVVVDSSGRARTIYRK